MSVINTNITSMIGQQNLRESSNALSTSMERLSSGMRINSAKDDAAGQAIANRMSAQITGLNQASRNANDGISIAQTAEGSLNQINDNVQRIRELTVQAENGTNSQADLGSIQDEIGQRLEEIDRISEETDFNGTKVLDEGIEEMTIQVGANDGETISIGLKAINSSELNIDDFSVRSVSDASTTYDAAEFGADIDDATAVTSAGAFVSGGSFSFAGEDFDVVSASANLTSGGGEMEVIAGENFDFAIESGSEVAEGTTVGDYTLVQNGGGDFFAYTGSGDTAEFYEVDVAAEASNGTAGATVSFTLAGGADAEGMDATEAGFTFDANDVAVKTENPLAQLDTALSEIDSLRSELGAVQNRFEDAITNLDTNSTNLSSARSRIEDADYASEVADMTRGQILQQAGTSVLAQANQLPQNVLSLLG